MSEIQRYTVTGYGALVIAHPQGGHVLFTDYQADINERDSHIARLEKTDEVKRDNESQISRDGSIQRYDWAVNGRITVDLQGRFVGYEQHKDEVSQLRRELHKEKCDHDTSRKLQVDFQIQAGRTIADLEAKLADRDEKLKVALGLLEKLSGSLAESVALDMDHRERDHSKWYRAVKRARKLLTTTQPNERTP